MYQRKSTGRQEIHTLPENAAVTTFGERLAAAMVLAGGLKQTDLARAIGCKKATIGQTVHGQTGRLSSELALLAAKVMDVDPFWLVLGEGEARPLLYKERRALSARAVYVGSKLDAIEDKARFERAYALIVQLLEFGD